MSPTEITVNGSTRPCAASPHTSLLDWLREQGWTGAKEGCAEGECGACAVLVARPEGVAPEGLGPAGSERTRWVSLNSCLPPALALDGQEIVTAEGLGEPPTPGRDAVLHPVQREMADRGGSQCGYCTPGFVCAMAAEFYRPERSSSALLSAEPYAHETAGPGSGEAAEVDARDAAEICDHDADEIGPNGFDLHALSGNLCRCTGYRPIRDAAHALGDPAAGDPLAQRRDSAAPVARATKVSASGTEFLRPADLAELLERLAQSPEAVLLAGATDAGVERNLRHTRAPLVLAIDRIEEMRGLSLSQDTLEIGAALTLTEIERALTGRVPLLDQLFPQFASRLIRNAATLGGNLGTGSPIGDAAPVLLALEARVLLASASAEREVALADYFTGYRESVRTPGELIRAVRIPLPPAPHSAFYKIAKRRFDDISSVAVAFALRLDGDRVADIRIGLGGVAATPLRATATEAALTGQPWDAATAAGAASVLGAEGTPLDDHRASARYRSAMLEQSLLRFHAEQGPTKHRQKDIFDQRNPGKNWGEAR